uniref:TACC_C domain-containing protein n=1 Tax=Caenorhabditis tropicalis TaxID=1561998 RepID=A0A1I7UX76_9PELO
MTSLNTTFTKEDGTEVVIPFNGTQSNVQEEEEAMETDLPEEEEQEEQPQPPIPTGTIARRRPVTETDGGMSRIEALALKLSSDAIADFWKRALHSEEFELRRCSNGQILSQGRCSTPANGNPNMDGGALNEELQKAMKDLNVARIENEKLHDNYSALFASFNELRKASTDLRAEYETAREKLKMAAAECEDWQTKFLNVKDNANAELERASLEYDQLVRTHDENTKGLRVRVKKMELDLMSSRDENRVLSTRVQELSAICDQLLNDADVCDGMSVVSTDA